MKFFNSSAALRRWLEKNHDREPELIIGFYRKSSRKKSISYQEALDEALCFGWIDGITHGVDHERYTIRFTPRRPRSNWSRVNIKRVGELAALGRMAPAGLKTFEARDPARESGYSYEATLRGLDAPYEKLFRADRRAWAFFEAQPPGYRRLASWWVMSAKREETRSRRLATSSRTLRTAAGRRRSREKLVVAPRWQRARGRRKRGVPVASGAGPAQRTRALRHGGGGSLAARPFRAAPSRSAPAASSPRGLRRARSPDRAGPPPPSPRCVVPSPVVEYPLHSLSVVE